MPGQFPELAAALVRDQPSVIVAQGEAAARAAQAATRTIPILASTNDLVASGLIASLAKPGGNITGESHLTPELDAKKLELLKEMLPGARRFGVLTARTSHIVKLRAGELGIDLVRQGFEDKLPAAQEIIRDCGLTPEKVCYIGDDLTDLPVIRHVGLGVAVADAAAEVRADAGHITKLPGGQGAVRELVELILKAQFRWEEIIQTYQV